jgi:hypothetical protein
MLITETLDWRDIVNQLPIGASKTLGFSQKQFPDYLS